MDRRTFIGTAAAGSFLVTTMCALAGNGYDNPRRAAGHTPTVRRRIRRQTFTRVIEGRTRWIVPTQLAVGWELVHAERVVVVRELKAEVALVADIGGKTQQIDIAREDNSINSQELDGSVLADSDHTTPARVTAAAT